MTKKIPKIKTKKEPAQKKLWQKKGFTLNPTIELYNSGDDVIYDQKLIPYDVQGSYAYGKMLNRHGILTDKDLIVLKKGLDEIMALYKAGKFQLKVEDEDCHTKIENYLTDHYGDIGKKIHTARSRNDQILVTMRLFMKEKMKEMKTLALLLVNDLLDMAQKHEFVPMPGFTHMQKAMPTTLGTWYGSFAESLLDDIKIMSAISDVLVDQNPLGSGAGYGSPFAFDRDLLSKDLGLSRTQSNVIYCHNSRGKIEGMVLESCCQIMLSLNKMASDFLLFTTQEFKFFTITDEIGTGSSIMPQKKNLDVAELIRGRTATVISCRNEITMNILNKVSGYHRDGQEIKRPLFLGLRYTEMSMKVASIIVKKLIPNEKSLYKDMTPELFATHKAFALVKKGKNFRDAYREVGLNLDKMRIDKDNIVKMLKESQHQGGAGNLQLDKLRKEAAYLAKQ
ncbi:argininosuccinate lyase [Candidatus Peregrinibacteria bacterium CG_4_10_14_0_2_um_filter_38_24]|nr:MAG: argininosuccinate lyase [Candidatus Peregrinibacteria bacterium CG_4_10_14_0_2_um_filter_38_24]PJC39372.1 MAG: argininosuccinate lyase [Candidatus Peregrinibacteria bacterium CG_4_9_14_0_2_um_filter_38_9]